jgi:hypothetical protein
VRTVSCERRIVNGYDLLIVYVVVDDARSPDFPLGDAVEVFVRRDDAERFIDEARR